MANKGSCDIFDKVAVLTIIEKCRVDLCAKKRFYGTQIKYARSHRKRILDKRPKLFIWRSYVVFAFG